MTTTTHFRLHPTAFASVGVGADDISGIIDCLLASGPHRVTVAGFDQTTAAAIADRLVFHGMDVHVDGSGQAEWRTPEVVYEALLTSIEARIQASRRESDVDSQ
ncbi:hypothetical protein R70006_06235 [Paraburkholderia domus]|uniref:hypothetical protein n=1 Tax=Paraburkholderia domus TaxID=2793075 RepID=UPI0019123DC1|nr:hypothetical protein [Paraburkholderia domus]MBK5052866.1 hypothetical protein [Burkholderia sp. R-70006]CAE6821771.1 hypothetical protein R70006_06235 [Paraburkholderia domus]